MTKEMESNNQCKFGDIAGEWFESVRMQIKESSSNKYKNLLDSYIYPCFGSVPLSNLTCDFIEAYCNELRCRGGRNGTGLSAKTTADILTIIRSILQFAARCGKDIPCDARLIRIRREFKEMRVLNNSEQEKLCQYLYANLNLCNLGILVCLFTGIRIGEICALRWEDISLYDQTIHVHQTMQRIQDKSGAGQKTKIVITTPKSLCSIRTIPIPDSLSRLIASQKKSGTGFFLTNSEYQYIEPRTMQNWFKRALKQSFVAPANYHSLRHTFATRCVELGFDAKSLSEILGHASVNITMNRYVHPPMSLKRENMQRLSMLSPLRQFC